MSSKINRYRMNEPKLKIKKCWLYFFFFCAIILCVVNTVFLIKNWKDLVINVDDTSNVMLTIIGVLFAFTAINIYSLFNTNIDAEKERVDRVADEYDNLLTAVDIQFPSFTSIVRFQMVVHAISASDSFNSQLLEWIQKATSLAKSFVPALRVILQSKLPNADALFKEFQFDISVVVRDAKYLMKDKAELVKADDFYGNNVNMKDTVITAINDLIDELERFETHDFWKNNQTEIKPEQDKEDDTITLYNRIKGGLSNWYKTTIKNRLHS